MVLKLSDCLRDLFLLLYGTDEINRNFRQNIRVYNNLFAFASFNSANKDIPKFNSGFYSMGVKGQASIRINGALKSEEPTYRQIYIWDDGEVMHFRSKKVKRDEVLQILQPTRGLRPLLASLADLPGSPSGAGTVGEWSEFARSANEA